jgi:hypothetical protein
MARTVVEGAKKKPANSLWERVCGPKTSRGAGSPGQPRLRFITGIHLLLRQMYTSSCVIFSPSVP